MRIFFVSRGWPSEREPQWGCFERDQALALKTLGYQIVVLSVDTRFRRYYRKYGITKEINEGIPHYNLFAGSIWGRVLRAGSFKLHTWVKNRLFMYMIQRVIKQEGKPDIIYAHYLGCSIMALSAKKKYGIPVVGIEHWSELGYKNIKKPIKNYAKKNYLKLDRFLTVSSSLRENILKNIGVDSVVVNNMVGQDFQYLPHDDKGQIVRFVATGNLLPVKGFDNLIKAFSQLDLPNDSWLLYIIGGGPESDYLQSLIDRFHLNKNILLLGRKNRDSIVEILHSCDVYIMSSRLETFGVAAIEALACGIPVISTECGGSSDFMNKDNGVTCPIDDVEKLASCINYMMGHYHEYDREKIAKDCLNRFSSEAIGRQLDKIFKEIVI